MRYICVRDFAGGDSWPLSKEVAKMLRELALDKGTSEADVAAALLEACVNVSKSWVPAGTPDDFSTN